MATTKTDGAAYGYREFKSDLKKGELKSVYVFHGEEQYLLRDAISQLRQMIPQGTEDFNHRRFEGKDMTLADFEDAVNTFPMFSDRVFVEVWDYDFDSGDADSKERFYSILSDVAEYVCVVFAYDTTEFKIDGRSQINKQIKKCLNIVEFKIQDTGSLLVWIRNHFAAEGKEISSTAAEYFAVMTGGQMTLMLSEIEKLAAYCNGTEITKNDIDAVVTPVVNTAVYEMMGRLIERDYDGAAKRLSNLISINTPPQVIMYDVTSTLRQILGARVCIENGVDMERYNQLLNMKNRSFLAKRYFNIARALDSKGWAKALACATNTAFLLHSESTDGKELLGEMLVKLALCIEGK